MELQVGVKVFLQNEQGHYLLLRRNPDTYPDITDLWDIPGGRIHTGTPLLENLVREVKEETGLALTSEPTLLCAQDILRGEEKHVVRLTYVASTTGEPVLDATEHAACTWCSRTELLHHQGLDRFAHAAVEQLIDRPVQPKATPIDLDRLLAFVKFTHLAHKVERVARIPGETRYATMLEHSYQLALTAWYLIEREGLPLDTARVLKYALVHDLMETYAGDTYLYDDAARATKREREAAACERMRAEFPEFSELHDLLEAYEQRIDNESRFVYALDKLIDPLNIYLEGGKLWNELGVSLPMIIEKKTDKVALDPTVKTYFDRLLVRLRECEDEIFP
jgi:putative hydrolase of HD superfamily